jgi:hypothetical protein
VSKVTDGRWRPNTPFSSSDGLQVVMRRAVGLTPKGVLLVPLRFQVPPLDQFRRAYRFNWSTFDTVAGGQHSRPMGAQLLELQIDTMLLDRIEQDRSSGVVIWDDAPNPELVLRELRYISGTDDARRGKAAPFRLVISQPAVWHDPLVNIVATLNNVEPAQHAGEIATEYLSVTFLEYAELAAGSQRRAPHEATSKLYKVKLGTDDLYELAKRFLHRASAWRRIAAANGIVGVSPGSEAQLAAWMKRHHKTTLIIPLVEFKGRKGRHETGSLGSIPT